jgi:putative salt-induced outer membrane protein
MTWTTRALSTCLLLALSANEAFAQDSLVADGKVSTGTTEVAVAGFKKAAAPPPNEQIEETAASIMAGGMLATGNAQSSAITGAASLRIRRGADQYSADIAGNFGRSSLVAGEPTEVTVENYQGVVRYDRFLSRKWAVFAQETGRRDRFQGLDLRLNFDPGLAHYFLIEEKQHLTIEAGYDMQYDIRTREAIADAAAAGTPVEANEIRHAARFFAGYDNSLNEHVRFDTGLEYLQAFLNTENYRLNWVNTLTASISTSFALAAGFTLRYDHNPLPGIKDLDTITTMNLVYTLR